MVSEYHLLLAHTLLPNCDPRARDKVSSLKAKINRSLEKDRKFKALHATSKRMNCLSIPTPVLSKIRSSNLTIHSSTNSKHPQGTLSSNPGVMLETASAFYHALYNRTHQDDVLLNAPNPSLNTSIPIRNVPSPAPLQTRKF